MTPDLDIVALATALRTSSGFTAKADIATVSAGLGLSGAVIPVGDDCAAISDGTGWTLFAIEGFINAFVARDPWFAGWCSVMVNLSDIAAMGGRATAIVDALWASDPEMARPIIDGMRAASAAYAVPIVGGHTNLKTEQAQLSVAVLGKATALLTSFDARPGERLVMAIDLRGAYREPFNNWQAALSAPPERLRGDLELLPEIAERGLARAAKDISQAGIVGTAAMLAECSGVGLAIDLEAIPIPPDVPLLRWLQTFPSFGFLLSVAPRNLATVIDIFARRGISATDIGEVRAGTSVTIAANGQVATVIDFAADTLMGYGGSTMAEATP